MTEFGTGHEVPWPLFVGDGAAAARAARERAERTGGWRDTIVAKLAAALAADELAELHAQLLMVAQTANDAAGAIRAKAACPNYRYR